MALYISHHYERGQSELLYAPYLILLGVSALDWIIGLVLYTMEHQKLGDISGNLRGFWIVSFFAQVIGVMVSELLVVHETSLGALEIVNIAFVTVLALLVIQSVLTKRSLADNTQKLSVVYVPYKDLRTRANSYKTPSFGTESEHLETSAEIMNKFLTFSQKQKGRSSTVADINSTAPNSLYDRKDEQSSLSENLSKPLLEKEEEEKKSSPTKEETIIMRPKGYSDARPRRKKEESALFEEIYIEKFVHLEKQGKSTIVYVIKYKKDGKLMDTRRSYSEFYKLYQKTRKHYPTALLPPFPEKKTKTESVESKTLAERREQLTQLLKRISEKRLHTTHLDEFLKSDDVLPNFSSRPSVILNINDIPKDQSSLEPIGDKPIVEEVDEVDLGLVDTVHRRRQPVTHSFADPDFCVRIEQTTPLAQTSQSLLTFPSQESMQRQVSPPNRINGEAIITDYANRKVGRKLSEEDNAYKVEIVSAWNDQRNGAGETATFYEFQIKDLINEKIYATSKRYSDFKTLHSQMKEYAKKIKTSLPAELPNRGTLGPMVRKTDPLLIEYRKFALPNYLQTLLNKRAFQDCNILLEFAEIK